MQGVGGGDVVFVAAGQNHTAVTSGGLLHPGAWCVWPAGAWRHLSQAGADGGVARRASGDGCVRLGTHADGVA